MTDDIDTNTISDGSHTFGELYEHQRALTAALCSVLTLDSWRSKRHHPDDTPILNGYFIVGIDLPIGTVTYHYEEKYWNDFQHVITFDHAPLWDGSTPDDAVKRLLAWVRGER